MNLDEPDPDTGPLERWVTEIAQSKDRPEQDVLDDLLSSYWIVNELSGMIRGNQPRDPNPPRAVADDGLTAHTTAETDSPGPSDGATDRELIRLLRDIVERDADPNTRSTRQGGSPTPPRETTDDITARVEEGGYGQEQRSLEPRIDELSERVTTVEEALTERIAAVEETVPDRIGEIENRVRAAERKHRTLETAIDDLSEEVATVQETLEGRISNTETDLSDRMEALEGQIDDDLDKVEGILASLYRSIDDLTERTDALTERYSQVEPLIEDYERRRRLADIRGAANREGIRTATCDSCDDSVDIGLLTDPTCPHCGRPFDRLTTRSWLWKTRTILTGNARDSVDEPLPTVSSENGSTTG